MSLKLLLWSCFWGLWSADCAAVIMRHDVDVKNYEVNAVPDYFIRLPHEGAGVLIAKEWILSAAHTVFYDYHGKEIEIHGVPNIFEKVIFHPGYKKDIPAALLKGNADKLTRFLESRDDVVLLKLKTPVEHVKPVRRYRGNQEIGMKITTYGDGATGNGLSGEIIQTKTARKLHRYQNIVDQVSSRWLELQFERGNSGLPLEGHTGSGDSGGPSIVIIDGEALLVGITCWQRYQGMLENFVGGKYGMSTVLARIANYNAWVDEVLSKD